MQWLIYLVVFFNVVTFFRLVYTYIRRVEYYFNGDIYMMSEQELKRLERAELQEEIAEELSEVIQEYGRPLTNDELTVHGFTQARLRHAFGTTKKALLAAIELARDSLYVLGTIDRLAMHALKSEINEHLAKGGKFLLTQAGAGCVPNTEILRGLDVYEKLGFMILIFPGADPARKNPGMDKNLLFFSPALKKYHMIQDDIKIGKHVQLCSILTSMKQILPLTGMTSIANPEEVTIIGSPKQFCLPMANMNDTPGEIISTGSITNADYQSSVYFSQRTSKIAEKKHQLGAIALEFGRAGRPLTTNILFKENGDSYYRGRLIRAKTKRISKARGVSVVFPDVHPNKSLNHTRKLIKEIVPLSPVNIVLHDDIDVDSLNPHKEKHAHIGTLLTPIFENFYEESQNYVKLLHLFCNVTDAQIISTYSNHPKFIERFVASGKHTGIRDKKSYKLLHKIADKMASAVDAHGRVTKSPAQILVEILDPDLANSGRVRWLLAQESFKIKGMECGQHGHIGKQGSRSPSTKALSESLGPHVAGHSHAKEIRGLGYRVSSIYGGGENRVAYALQGPDVWDVTYAVIYDTLLTQLVSTEIS